MHLLPVPVTPEYLQGFRPLWLPFLERIASRGLESVESLHDRIMRGEVQPVLIWDGKEARALCGVRFYLLGDDKIAEWVWMTGSGRREWEHLLSDMERFMADMGAIVCQPVCRKGWARLLKKRGYEITGHRDGHIIMEKRLWAAAAEAAPHRTS